MENQISSGDPLPIASVLANGTTRLRQLAATSDERHAAYAEEERQREQSQKMAFRDSVWNALLSATGPRYKTCSLKNYEVQHDAQKPVVTKVQSYIDEIDQRFADGQNVLFLGPAGCGKDHLAFAMMKAHVGAFRTVLWLNGSALWLAMRSAIGTNHRPRLPRLSEHGLFNGDVDGSEMEIVSKLQMVDVLTLSDPLPAGGTITDYQANTLFSIVDERYRQMRPTIMTCNASSRADLEARMGVPVVDRMAHGALVLACDWPSYRKGTAK